MLKCGVRAPLLGVTTELQVGTFTGATTLQRVGGACHASRKGELAAGTENPANNTYA